MAVRDAGQRSSSYKWTALSNTTLGVFMASVRGGKFFDRDIAPGEAASPEESGPQGVGV